MRSVAALGLVACLSSAVWAQPGAYPPSSPYPAYPAAPPPVMQVQLTLDEQYLLERGYISPAEHIGGGAVALAVGFGVGHAIQRRWLDRGWIFTLGEGAAGVAVVYGFLKMLTCPTWGGDNSSESCRDGTYGWMIGGGMLASVILRVWEVADAFIAPANHNRALTQLRARLGLGMPVAVVPYVAPLRSADGGGGVVGLTLRF